MGLLDEFLKMSVINGVFIKCLRFYQADFYHVSFIAL